MLRQHNDARDAAISTRAADCRRCHLPALLRILDEAQDVGVQPVHVRVHEAVGRALVDLEPAARNQHGGRDSSQRERRRDVTITLRDQR